MCDARVQICVISQSGGVAIVCVTPGDNWGFLFSVIPRGSSFVISGRLLQFP